MFAARSLSNDDVRELAILCMHIIIRSRGAPSANEKEEKCNKRIEQILAVMMLLGYYHKFEIKSLKQSF